MPSKVLAAISRVLHHGTSTGNATMFISCAFLVFTMDCCSLFGHAEFSEFINNSALGLPEHFKAAYFVMK